MQIGLGELRHFSPRILLLGGTSEASQLAATLSAREDLTVITSLAGRVSQPPLIGGIVRIGGFGGAVGLASYLREEAISVVIDVTHPFAAQISKNAKQACGNLGVPLLAFDRPPWTPTAYDQWTHVVDVRAAALLISNKKSCVFLSIGRQEVGAFALCREPWFLIRAIDHPGEPLPPRSKVILDRGPFDLASERKMLREESIDILITKNSGGSATYPKIEAARERNLEVIMIDRPKESSFSKFSDLEELVQSLWHILESRSTMRGIDGI